MGVFSYLQVSLSCAADEVLIIKSVTHKDFNAMIKVKITSKEANIFVLS